MIRPTTCLNSYCSCNSGYRGGAPFDSIYSSFEGRLIGIGLLKLDRGELCGSLIETDSFVLDSMLYFRSSWTTPFGSLDSWDLAHFGGTGLLKLNRGKSGCVLIRPTTCSLTYCSCTSVAYFSVLPRDTDDASRCWTFCFIIE